MPPPEAVIVGEPSEMRVVTGQKGSWGFRARVRGHEVHSSLMHTGVSAIHEAARFIAWTAGRDGPRGGRDAPERLRPAVDDDPRRPDRGRHRQQHHRADCTFSGEVRCLPDQDPADWRARLLAEAARRTAAMRADPPRHRLRLRGPDAAPGLSRRRARPRPSPGRSPATTAAPSSPTRPRPATSRRAASPTVICGPGSIAQAHQPDEFITSDQLDAGTAFMRRLIHRLAA